MHVCNFESNTFISNTRLRFDPKQLQSQVSKAVKKINVVNESKEHYCYKIHIYIINKKQCFYPVLLYTTPIGPFKNDITMKMHNIRPPSPMSLLVTFFIVHSPPCHQVNSNKLFP